MSSPNETDTAAYIATMTEDLANMARISGLELLAYLLSLANLEAEGRKTRAPSSR